MGLRGGQVDEIRTAALAKAPKDQVRFGAPWGLPSSLKVHNASDMVRDEARSKNGLERRKI